MSTIVPSGVWLVPASGAALRVRDVGYRHQMNAGISWDCLIPQYLSGTAYTENDTFTLVVRQPDGAAYTTPPLSLTAFTGDRGIGGRYTQLSGVDYVSSRLSTKNYNGTTQWYTLNWDIISAIATLAGITVGFHGSAPKFRVREFNIQGQELSSHLSRMLRDSAMNWRNNSGQMEVLPANYSMTPADVGVSTVYIARTTERFDFTNKIEQVILHLSLRNPGEYVFRCEETGVFSGDISGGLRNVNAAFVEQTSGLKLGYAATFSGPNGSGLLTGFFPFSSEYTGVNPGPSDGSVATRSVKYVCIPGTGSLPFNPYAKFKVTGSLVDPRSYDIEPYLLDSTQWEVTYPTSLPPGARRRYEVIDSPLWGHRTGWLGAFGSIDAAAPSFLKELNKQVRTVTHVLSQFDPRLSLPGWTLPADAGPNPDFPQARYDTIEWRAGDSGYEMTVTGTEWP